MIWIAIAKLVLPLCIPIAFWSCSGQESAVSQGRGGDDVAQFSLNITDAPVDGVTEVWIQITGYTIQLADGDAITGEFDPVNVNLLSLQGNNSLNLVDQNTVPAGDYDWLRLHVNASLDGVTDSYVTLLDGSTPEINIPSGSQSGLKINTPFTLEADVETSKTIDFDLRQSLVLTGSGQYQLRPTLRLVDDALAGTLIGKVDPALVSSAIQCSDADPDTYNVVYVFDGFDVVPDDIDGKNPDPVTSANVNWDAASGEYVYELGFLEEGDYTLALTCQADLDDPTTDDVIIFVNVENVTLVADEDNTGIDLNPR